MTNAYLEVISLIERLHRNFLEVVKLELEGLGIHDINNVQGMMLYNIGDAEMTVGDLTQERSLHDRRSIRVRLTEKGVRLRDRVSVMHQRHQEMIGQAALNMEDLQTV